MKCCAQTFLPNFGLFAIFDCNLVNIVAPPSNKDENSLVHLKGQSTMENMVKLHPN